MQSPRQALVPAPPQFNDNVKPVPGAMIGRAGPMLSPRPGSADFKRLIPPPAPDPEGTPVAQAPAVNGTTAVIAPMSPETVLHQRMVVSFGPDPTKRVVGIETAPDWDIEESYVVSRSALAELLPILKSLVKIKNLTGESLDAAQNAD